MIAIGNFDGIHLGHQRVLEYALNRAKESAAVATALTFEPSPLKILRPDSAPLRISTNQQRMEWFGIVGLEAAVVLPFTLELSQLTPEEFVRDLLVEQLQVRAIVVGDNFRFGHKQAGDVKFLRELGMRCGFEVVVHEPVSLDGEIVSSTLIRKQIAEGDVTRAGRLLGRPFVLDGRSRQGDGHRKEAPVPDDESETGPGTAPGARCLHHAHGTRGRTEQSPKRNECRNPSHLERGRDDGRDSSAGLFRKFYSGANRDPLLEAIAGREEIQRHRRVARADCARYFEGEPLLCAIA